MNIVININDCEYEKIKEDAEKFRSKGMAVPYLYKEIESGIPLRAIEQDPCEDPKLVSVRQELLDRGDEMVSFRQLVERFDEVEEYFKGIPWNLKQIYNNFNILIGEKPCTDAISRQAVIDYIRDNYRRWFINDDAFIQCMNGIKDFISVTPQSKMGHWEWVQYDYNTKLGDWHCSECRSVVVECVDKNEKGGIPMYKYCPQCGIKMKEVDE